MAFVGDLPIVWGSRGNMYGELADALFGKGPLFSGRSMNPQLEDPYYKGSDGLNWKEDVFKTAITALFTGDLNPFWNPFYNFKAKAEEKIQKAMKDQWKNYWNTLSQEEKEYWSTPVNPEKGDYTPYYASEQGQAEWRQDIIQRGDTYYKNPITGKEGWDWKYNPQDPHNANPNYNDATGWFDAEGNYYENPNYAAWRSWSPDNKNDPRNWALMPYYQMATQQYGPANVFDLAYNFSGAYRMGLTPQINNRFAGGSVPDLEWFKRYKRGNTPRKGQGPTVTL